MDAVQLLDTLNTIATDLLNDPTSPGPTPNCGLTVTLPDGTTHRLTSATLAWTDENHPDWTGERAPYVALDVTE